MRAQRTFGMRGESPSPGWGRWVLLLAACVLMLRAWAEPIIPGLVTGTLDPELRGQVLIEELNCVACHASEGSLKARSKQAPRLSQVGSRVNPAYLERYIAAPHETLPGTSMPDVLAALDPEERRHTARAITHFLLSLRKNEFSLQPPDAVAAGHGQRLFVSRGCVACHLPPESNGTGPLISWVGSP